MRNFLLGVVTGAILFVLAAILYLRLGFAEVRGDLPPSWFESKLMSAAVHSSVRREAPEIPSPVEPTDENLIAGGKLFISDCSGCHGAFKGAEDNSDTLFLGFRSSTRWVRNTPKRRSSGLQSTVFDAAECLLMESGTPTRTYGPWQLTSTALAIYLQRSRAH